MGNCMSPKAAAPVSEPKDGAAPKEEPKTETPKAAAPVTEEVKETPKEEPKKNPVDTIEAGQVVSTFKGIQGKVVARTTTDFTVATDQGELTIPAEDIMLLDVIIKSAKGLRNADWKYVDGVSDPYCIVEIEKKVNVEGATTMKLQTKVVKDALDVEWMHEEGMYGYVKGDSLRFSVWDKDMVKSDPLGSVELKSEQFHLKGFEGELKLDGKGAGGTATIQIKVMKPMTEEEYVEAVIEGKEEGKNCCC